MHKKTTNKHSIRRNPFYRANLMSTTAKTIFVASCIFTGIVVYKVHEYQDEERKVIFFLLKYLDWSSNFKPRLTGLHKADTNNKKYSI